MDNEITRAEARKLLNCHSNYRLAKVLGVTHQYVYLWDDERPIPKPQQRKVLKLVQESARADNTPCSNLRRP